MQALLKFLKWAAIVFGGLMALIILAVVYGSMTPTADIDAKRKVEAERVRQKAEIDATNKAAFEAGQRMGKAILAVDKAAEDRKRIYESGFNLGKTRGESGKRMPDLSFMNNLAREIIESYGLESKQGDLEAQFRAGYAKGYMTGK